MRITYLAATGQIGGAERVLLECISSERLRSEVSLVTLGAGPLRDAAAALGAAVTVVEPPDALRRAGDAFGGGGIARDFVPMLRSFPGFFSRFSDAVSSSAPDVVHSHGIKTHVLGSLMARRAPVVWHVHDYIGARAVSAKMLRCLAHRCALAIAVSRSVAEDARSVLAGTAIDVVHNAVDESRFTPEGNVLDLDRLASLPAAPAGVMRIGLPATFARWKGQEVFLEAIARLARADVRAYVIGGAVYETRNSQWTREELVAMATSLGLAGKIGFTGAIDDMPAAYRALDIVVHASTRPEPFGLVIAEAMACGRALVATPAGGAGELFASGEDAEAAGGNDPAALADALGRLLADRPRREQLGRRARARAVEHFGRRRFAADLQRAMSAVNAPLVAEAV